MKKLILGMLGAVGLMVVAPAHAETTECTEITTLPTAITVQGVYCLKQNLQTAATSGNVIDIQTNNVTIDFNGFKLGGLAAGAATQAVGVYAENRQNIVLRNGSIRGFNTGIMLLQTGGGTSSGHLIEDAIFDGNRYRGLLAEGSGMVVRNNRIVNTGPYGLGLVSYGMVITAENSLIIDNLVSKTTEVNSTTGIYVTDSALLELRGNSVLETDGAALNRGIHLLDTTDTTIIDNRVLNPAGTGTTGIGVDGTSSGINCIGNTIAGFTTATSDCDYPADNHTP